MADTTIRCARISEATTGFEERPPRERRARVRAAVRLTAAFAALAVPIAAAAQAQPAHAPASITVDATRRFPNQMPGLQLGGVKRPTGGANWMLPAGAVESLNVQEVVQALQKRMTGKSIGYSVTVIGRTGQEMSASDGWARKGPPDAAPRKWTANDRITIASVSKTITAAAVMKALAANKVSLDDPAWKHLIEEPIWKYSDTFKQITIRQLLNHTSGIRGCGISLGELSDCISKPISAAAKDPNLPLSERYQNTNLAFMRVMLPRLYGQKPVGQDDIAAAYVTIVRDTILTPAGVANAQCKPTDATPALSYESVTDDSKDSGSAAVDFDWANVKPGVNWGDMTAICGSQGWNLSSADLARFMHKLMLTDTIIPQSLVDQMRSDNLGMFFWNPGHNLEGWQHSGWHPASWNNGEINTFIVAFNNGITVGMIVNSRYHGNYWTDIVEAVASLKP